MTGPNPFEGAASSIPSAAPAELHTPPSLASHPRILDRFIHDVRACGLVGEDRNAQLVFLALTSRILDEPVSLALKGVSSSGKSETVSRTLKFFPPSAYLEMTAMSERALVYMKEDFAHRTLVVFEAVALREQREKAESNLTAYFVRSLLSEGRISYPVTQRDRGGNFSTVWIVKNGPTNIILTTTATSLHGENETRLISLPTNDTPEQTAAILLRLATGTPGQVDFEVWHCLHRWLEGTEHRVVIPFAKFLAQSVPPVAVRLRRDFRSVLRLIETHALLHQESRPRDALGAVVATVEDYLVVRNLVADLISDGVGATVPGTVRETVEVVRRLQDDRSLGVTTRAVAEELELDRSATSRRLQAARERGYVVNLETGRGRPARYAIGDAMPDEMDLLPHTCTPDATGAAAQERVCSSAAAREGEEPGWRRVQRDAGEEPETDDAVAWARVQRYLGGVAGG